ncbi:3137_t:CDS:2 [Ambispora leptoticha]|uniref:3137_t:CDS:1 n=1 Tax=Ambispora leptoticha TaxID=144679 RepID=A0A9N8VSV3_9GLOM|nr:3137_t:CDS:2 [Ambispora leptoticha]
MEGRISSTLESFLPSFFQKHNSKNQNSSRKDYKPEIIVSWGKEKFHIGFEKEGSGSLEETTLKELKERLKSITGVPLNGQKLVYSGAIMKDENSNLSSLGIHAASKILLIGSKPDKTQLAETSSGSPEEHALISRISASVEKIRNTSLPQIESFETQVANYISSNNHQEIIKVHQKLTETHHLIVENLMQSLLSLDSVDCPQDFQVARQKRREAVKFTQGLIDRADRAKEQLAQDSSSLL